jgi:hypothetical protein
LPEVAVTRPVRGSIDLVAHDRPGRVLVATEIESLLRRLEQLLRWHQDKAAALPSSQLWRFVAGEDRVSVSRLLIVRSTSTNREIARQHDGLLRAAYPGRAREARAALTGDTPWPGPTVLWADIRGSAAVILEGPPRGVTLGR